MSGRSRAGGSVNRSRATTGRALARVVAGFVLLAGQVGPLASGVLAADPHHEPLLHDADAVVDRGRGVEASPAPIDIRDGAGGPGGGSTYTVPGRGIELRPTIHQPAAPKVPTEDPSKRTEHSRVVANPDGTYTAEVSQGRLNYKDANGTWQPLDLTLIDEKSGAYGLRVAATDATVRFADSNADAALAQIIDGTYSIGVRAIGYGAAAARTDDSLTFPGSGSNGEVGVLPTDYGFEFHVTIDKSDRAAVYHFALDTGGLTAQLDKDGATVLLIDPATNQTAGRISAPVLREGLGDNGDTTHVSVQLIGRGAQNIPDDVPAAAAQSLGANEVLLTYRIDPEWLHSPERQFPVVLDPSVCIRKGSGCDAAGAFDVWIGDGQPTLWVNSATTNYDHVGDYVSTAAPWGMTRGIFYFPDMLLPDEGAMVTSATLTLREFHNYSGTTSQNIYAQLMNKAWLVDSSQATWNNLHAAVNSAYDSPMVHPCNAGATDCDVNFDVGKMVRAWYTRRPQDWKANVGIEVRYDTTAENANKDEVSFYNGNNGTAGNRPQLTINYVVPAVGIDFAPELGNTYAPSAMDVGKVTKLPIIVHNNSGLTFNTTTDAAGFAFKAGYRWFDDEGKAMTCPTGGGDCTQVLPAAINAGASSGTFALNVQAPAIAGSYTLRVELAHVHVSDSKIDWASDWAKPSLYFSRNKKILTSDNTRWVGLSAIERDEFGITVGAGGGTNSGELKTLALSDGNTIAVNLGSANLHYEGGKTVGFDDLIDVGVSYGYDLANVADCTGILDACGWYTNWDERLVAQGDYSYLYQAPSGNRYLASMDGDGQIAGGAPVLLERTRFTLWNESNLSGWSGTAPVVSTSYAHSGTHSLQISAAGSGTQASYPSLVDTEHFPYLYMWVKSTGTDKAAIGFKVLDGDDTANPHWFFYTFGNTSWTVPSYPSKFIDTGTALTSAGGYWLSAANLLTDVRAAISGLSLDLSFQTVDLRGSAGGTGSLYYDDVYVRSSSSTMLDESQPAWTSPNPPSGLSTDRVVGSYSLVIPSAPLASSPDCVGCRNTDLRQLPWFDWWWKKSGGNSIAEVFYFKDARDTSKTGTITYYAGPVAPAGAVNPVQVSPTLPADWSHVHRNLLEDARQILNFYNDYPLGTSPSSPPAPPAPDGVTLTGYKLSGVDGNFALFDYERHTHAPTPDSGASGVEDFMANYADRSKHYFNADGLLERIVDKDGNTVTLDWTYDYTKSGPAAYTLTRIHAPTDGTSAPGGTTYRRYLDVARDTTTIPGLGDTSFIERLGTAAVNIDGRRNDFWVSISTTSSAADPGQTFGPGDLISVSPIQKTSSRCDGTRPTGCDEFSYLAATAHQLRQVRDPRWNGTITGGADDKRWKIWYGGGPTGVADLTGSTVLNIVSYDAGSSAVFARAIWQDADARAANNAQYVDLSPEGSVVVAYTQKACQGTCTFGSTGTYPVAPTSADTAASTTMDGLARISSVFSYRVAGASPQRTASRSGSNAAARVDNYADPLAANQIAWSQTNDQFLASLRDSGGTNPDLYRTRYAYDDDHQLIDTLTPTYNATPGYADVINAKNDSRKGYWRLDEASGSALDQANTYPLTVTATGVTRSQPGGLVNDPDTAMTFVGASSGRAYTTALSISQSAYTLEAWVKLTSAQTDKGIVGDYSSNSGAVIYLESNGHLGLAHNTARVVSSITPAVGRWYHVAATWDANTDVAILYVDGEVAAEGAVSMAPGAGGASFEIGAYGNGLAGKFVSATIDEAAYHDRAIGPVRVAQHYMAGRSVALVDSQSAYDAEGHRIQQSTSFLANGGFEGGVVGWESLNGTAAHVVTTPDATINTGFGSLQLTGSQFARQTVQLVPGQTFRFQVAHRSDGVAGSSAKIQVRYRRVSDHTWVDLLSTAYSASSWATHAWDFTLPMDANGLVEVVLDNNADTGTVWFDDAVLVTDWHKNTFASNGVLASSFVLSLTGGVGGTVMTYHQQAQAADHPGIFDTAVTSNYVDGVPDAAMDTDVITTRAVDAWGRTTQTVDADGVVVGAQTFAANKVDVASVTDSAGRTTTFTYDAVGNTLTASDPAGTTGFTYDLANHTMGTTGRDGVTTLDAYNAYGQRTTTTANYVDGSPSGPSGDDDVATTYAYDAYGNVITTIADAGAGLLGAKTTATFDLLGSDTSTSAYPGAGGTGTARTTTRRFETYTSPTGSTYPYSGLTFSRQQPSAVQLPIAPTGAPAPLCPDNSGARCNTVSTLDLAGRATSTTDAYGIVTRSYLDLAGRQVRVVANATTAADDGLNDQNITTDTAYDLHGNPVTIRLPLTTTSWRSDIKAYDALDRLTSVTHKDSAGATVTTDSTAYLRSGRIRTTSDGSSTTATRYDALGRPSATIANSDPTFAGMTLDALEGTTGNWSTGASGFFTTSAAAAKTDDTDSAGNAYSTVAPVSGRGRLHVTTHATNTNDGVWLDISGPNYQATHVYKAAFDLATSTAGLSLTAYLGQDASGGSYGSLGITSTTTWTRYTVSWTAGSSLTTPIRFAVRKPAAGTSELYLDNLVVWDSTTPDVGIVSSLSAYDADGEIIASVLPPGDPATERPLVTTVAFDPAGRTVQSVTNGSSGAYAASVLGTSLLAAYFPLDERTGTSAVDKKSGGAALTVPTTMTLGTAGGIDEARTGVRLTGSNGYLSRSSNATSNTTNVSMEAWIRTDGTPASPVVVAANGDASNGWGIAVDSTGNASGFTLSGSTFTIMASSAPVTNGGWHHVVLTRGASVWAMTIDGSAQSLSNNTTSPGTPAASFTIGALSGGSRPFVGEVDEVSAFTADISGSTAAAHWSAGRRPVTDTTTALTTRNAYDRLGRVTDAWAPDLVRTKAVYDRLGNQTATTANYRDGTTTGGIADDDVKSTFAYDVLGELIGYCPAVEVGVGGCDPASGSEVQAWHYGFDAMGRQTTTIAPDNTAAADLTTEEVVYETGGRIAKTCRYPAGTSCGTYSSRHTDFTYDNLGRILTQKTWDRGANPAADVLKFTKTLTWNADGSPATVNEGSDTLTYAYDTAGRLSQFKRGAMVLTGYTYTAATSTIATRTDGTQGATAFTYDWARRETIIDPPDAFVTGTVSRTYRLDGLLATQGFPSSITETLAYDEAKRPTSIALGGSDSISQSFDRAGRVTSDGRSLSGITGDAGTGTQSFSYDALSRLTGSTGLAVNRSYQYDIDGNRTQKVEGGTTTDYTYDRADQVANQTIGATTKTYDYDRYGNLLTSADNLSQVTTYAYDEANRLTTITPPTGGQITFTVDALDRHATKSVGGSLSDTFQYLDATETAWQTGQGTTTSSLLDADGSRLAIKTGTSVSWLLFDLHGSVVALCTAGTSTITDAYRFDGFGQQIDSAGTATNPWRYRGLLNIGGPALADAVLDMGARDYSPQLGQFTQLDSVQGSAANPMTMNRFLYALANPTTLVDPDGHRACLEDDSGRCTPTPTVSSTATQRSKTSAPTPPNLYHCVSSICNPSGTTGGLEVSASPAPDPTIRDNYARDAALGNTWTPSADELRQLMLMPYFSLCKDLKCIMKLVQETASYDAANEGPDLAPSYVTVNASYVVGFNLGGSGSVIFTRAGKVFLNWGLAVGTNGGSGDVRAGWMQGCSGRACPVNDFVHGQSVSVAGCVCAWGGFGLSGAATWGRIGDLRPQGFALEAGVGLGNTSGSASYTLSSTELPVGGFRW